MPVAQSNRLAILDFSRGIAALIVIFCHAIGAFYPSWLVSGDTPGLLRIWMPISGQSAVCFFFVLSGFVLSLNFARHLSFRGLIAASVKRPIRLGPAIWISGLICALGIHFAWFSHRELASVTGSDWLRNLWAVENPLESYAGFLLTAPFIGMAAFNAALWTVYIELYGSILCFVLMYLLSFIHNPWKITLSLLLTIWLRDTPYCAFTFGMALSMIYLKHPQWLPRSIGLSVLLTMVGIFFWGYPSFLIGGAAYPQFASLWLGWNMLSSMLLVTLIVTHAGALNRYVSGNICHWLGDVSYAIYAIHLFVLGALFAPLCVWLLNRGLPTLVVFLLSSVCYLAVTFMLGHGLTRWVDRPAIRLGNWVSKKIYRPK